MIYIKAVFNTNNFNFTYSKNKVDNHVLWENHCHSLYEMIAVLEGDISVTLEGKTYRLIKNQVIIIPPLCYHTVTANIIGNYQRVTALFDHTAIPSVLQKNFAQINSSPILCSNSWMDDFYSVFETSPSPYYEPLVESLMTHLFYKCIQKFDNTTINTDTNQFIEQIISYIDKHMLDRIVLDDLAKHTARSKSLVCHLFEKQMGIPPQQYILQKRMAYAQMQLRDGHSATSVAVELGYKSYSSFWRMYQKHYGTTPLQTKLKTPFESVP